MLASPPVPSFYNRQRDSSMSPSCRSHSNARRNPNVRQRPLFSARPEGSFSQLPAKHPLLPLDFHRLPSISGPFSYAVDDDEDARVLESPSASRSPPFPVLTSPPLLTPIKRSSGDFDELNQSAIFDTPSSIQHIPHPGGGLKRKPYRQSTPLRKHTLTPLSITSNPTRGNQTPSMDRLAPLPLPAFTARTPKSKSAEHKQTSMHSLRITDLNNSDEDLHTGNDSGLDVGDEEQADALFLGGDNPALGAVIFRKPLRMKGRGNKDSDEVAEAISPGGHITKRRARSRPLSNELLESVRAPTSAAMPKTSGVMFPNSRSRNDSSGSSSSDLVSPIPRRRVSGLHSPQPSVPPQLKRAPFTRVDSATLFFGPPVRSSPVAPPPRRARVSTSVSSPNATATSNSSFRPKMMNRHSYSGSGSLSAWGEMQVRANAHSPQSSPPRVAEGTDNELTDEDDSMIIDDIPPNSSFTPSLSRSTASPQKQSDMISKKFKARDSGIALSDDDAMDIFADHPENTMPRASTSIGSLYSDGEDGLITPGAGPRPGSGWPETVIVAGGDDPYAFLSPTTKNNHDVDAFILRTLAAASKAPQEEKKAPGTPVKRTKISYLSGARPWQSAVTQKVGLAQREQKKAKAPRKSLPAVFPSLGRRSSSRSLLENATDSEDDSDDSPSTAKDRYAGLGLGRPPFPIQVGKNGIARTRWLARRTSSGAFSSGSDCLSTPTRNQGYRPVQHSPSKNSSKLSPARSTSGSSNSSLATLNSPVNARRNLPISGNRLGRANEVLLPEVQSKPSRFERDFVEIAEIGRGEFGKVIKARMRVNESTECFAIKKSKQFEGARHRLRLREEVEILQHLANKSGSRGQPNVLAFADSWEEDEHLYICTELCDLGNFARFLWEYGRVFPRLDEARVWKIIADLSNGLRFIHDSGVIHLDLKPANIFVTGEGRFKIGDFGMASLWPRPRTASTLFLGAFEREGDKLYLAPEVLQGTYGKAADVFSFGMTILETASNIVVPDQGEAWHSLRREDFSQVDLDDSPELLGLIHGMMRTEPSQRLTTEEVYEHPVVSRARIKMEQVYETAVKNGSPVFAASPLASVSAGFLKEILDL
ncbi:hypothetical protein E1B28_000631 [Marasmius oreades]|uniref:Protein kinase domain-containing protein n=1 Tax=Marasmius oreades TaxID=181124 RepID=A0A9P7V1V5_9AGAR|nr:uncharacterized protein E1B28_000631 [Marasmius oreades]KAG7098718.1 hypothetical protein E1B28_000631 [Marasmius oreades]